jgi:membrane fusion protein, multidrug efflux system
MTLRPVLGCLLLGGALAASACSGGEAVSTTPPAGGAGGRGGGQGAAVPVTAASAQQKAVPLDVTAIGTVIAASTVAVRAQITGELMSVNFKEGDEVEQGQVLFTLDKRPFEAALAQADAQLQKDQAQLVNAKAQAVRYQDLAQRGIATREQVDQITTQAASLEATVAADRANIQAAKVQLDYATIEAPISGRTGLIRVTPGNLVSSSDPLGLVTITQVRPIRVSFTLAERDLSLIRKAYITKPPAVVRAYAAGEGEALATGELEFLDSAVDTASGTIAVKARFANEDFKLWPGMYVDVGIDLSVRPNTVMIPTVAIQSGQNGPFVFVVKDGKAEMHKVELAGVEGDRAALVSGVNDGEKVIVEGQMRLVDGARVVEGTSSNAGKAVGATQPTESEVAK